MARRSPEPVPLADLLDSWLLSLRAERKSAQTIKSYGDGVRKFLGYCEIEQIPAVLDRPTVNAFTAALLDGGAEAATARSRQLAVRRFSSWLADEGEIADDLLIGLKPPKLDKKVVPSLSDEQAVALIKACKGSEFRDRRDEALVRLMLESGMRAGEAVDLRRGDVDLSNLTVIVRRGKGGKARTVPISATTGKSIDRYLRARRSHALADSDALWLGERSKSFTYDALHKSLKWRAEDIARIPHFHPHMLRHTAASRWLARGGSEGGLMAVAGWSTRDMIDRYTADTAAARAADEARSLGLGDI
ncbi:tyrosine-type recombinase/integrase [Gordonia sp. SND2]|uniref:tyrosine-type recombinase/integrase n=1 Tax=Gordonia sp. SND2 TaxID=3388659 RepID=UPI00398B5F99